MLTVDSGYFRTDVVECPNCKRQVNLTKDNVATVRPGDETKPTDDDDKAGKEAAKIAPAKRMSLWEAATQAAKDRALGRLPAVASASALSISAPVLQDVAPARSSSVSLHQKIMVSDSTVKRLERPRPFAGERQYDFNQRLAAFEAEAAKPPVTVDLRESINSAELWRAALGRPTPPKSAFHAACDQHLSAIASSPANHQYPHARCHRHLGRTQSSAESSVPCGALVATATANI